MSKILELKSGLKTKKEWYNYIDLLYKNGIMDLEGHSKMFHAIRDSKIPDGDSEWKGVVLNVMKFLKLRIIGNL